MPIPHRLRRALASLAAIAALAVSGGALASPNLASPDLDRPWPGPDETAGIRGEPVSFPSRSPFSPADATDLAATPQTAAVAHLFMPEGRHAPGSIPAVVFLHGSGGVLQAREMTYGAQLARMGVAALVIDAFAARRDYGTSFIGRLLSITETMMVADAYAGLRHLSGLPAIDPKRVALVGFSYGAMASMYALNDAMAARMAPDGLRFAAHAAYYGPCIASFAEPRTTGAPLLMLWGDQDELIEFDRCQAFASEARQGGSQVRTIVYPGAMHQWDGAWGRRTIGRLMHGCDFQVESDGTVRDRNTGMAMSGPITRRIILALCVNDTPYQIGRDDYVRGLSNRELGKFLTQAFRAPGSQG